MMNRYYILPYPNEINSLLSIIVGEFDTQRLSLKGDKIVIKLPVDDIRNHPILEGIKEYTHNQIIEIMNSNEWIKIESI